MVFSNQYANLSKLSRDRWKILRPTEEGLETIEQVKTKRSLRDYGKIGFKW